MPEQLFPVGLLATIVFSSVTVYPELRMPPPLLALLPEKVLLLTVSPPKLEIPPPAWPALLPEKVLLLTVTVLVLLEMPPPLLLALLPKKVLLLTVSMTL